MRNGIGKCNGKVVVLPLDLYERWRPGGTAQAACREAADLPPSERLLQQIWRHQRLLRDRLVTLDGTAVRVLHPGFWNREAGPDFTRALLQFDRQPPCTGDVEIDLEPAGWRGHAHDRNPAYTGVALHVVWEARGRVSSRVPTLALQDRLDAPLGELRRWLGAGPGLPETLTGRCAAPLAGLDRAGVIALLDQAARVRLLAKAHQLDARARQAGWEAALWEGLFAGLGYKHNIWPMRRLAELLPAFEPAPAGAPPLVWQARLFGLAGLLPEDGPAAGREARRYLRTLWDYWWREQSSFNEVLVPRALWRWGGVRPANHPQRRLALASHWLARGHLPARIDGWFETQASLRQAVHGLLALLQGGEDRFWSRHWTFKSHALAVPRPLLGAARATDLAMNVLLPWCWTRAAAGRNDALRLRAEQRYFEWPAGADNAILRLARQRLFGGERGFRPGTAAQQQGLLQIVRDFCAASNARCDDCRFPGLVRSGPILATDPPAPAFKPS